jgi:hypothetical protein
VIAAVSITAIPALFDKLHALRAVALPFKIPAKNRTL